MFCGDDMLIVCRVFLLVGISVRGSGCGQNIYDDVVIMYRYGRGGWRGLLKQGKV